MNSALLVYRAQIVNTMLSTERKKKKATIYSTMLLNTFIFYKSQCHPHTLDNWYCGTYLWETLLRKQPMLGVAMDLHTPVIIPGPSRVPEPTDWKPLEELGDTLGTFLLSLSICGPKVWTSGDFLVHSFSLTSGQVQLRGVEVREVFLPHLQ